MKKTTPKIWYSPVVLLIGVVSCTTLSCTREVEHAKPAEIQAAPEPAAPIEQPPPPEPAVVERTIKLKRNSSVYETLRAGGLDPQNIQRLVAAAKPHFDLSRITPGVTISTWTIPELDQRVTKAAFKISPRKTLLVSRSHDNQWSPSMETKPVEVSVHGFEGTVSSSLWHSAMGVGLPPRAIGDLAEIFAWQIDFDRELRPGDTWRVTIEQISVAGAHLRWGKILAAQYVRGEDTYVGIRFESPTRGAQYFSPEGDSLRSKFLKSPLRYSRISSRFTLKRYHPILGVKRPHYGVDYAAARGTPVRAVGDGVIRVRARQGGSGKTIRIRHNSTYQTAYKHLSRYGKGMKRGKRVHQGDVIGYVGSTGLATGPHLHFEFYENGKYTDPLGRKFPREDPVPTSERQSFNTVAEAATSKLQEFTVSGSVLADAPFIGPRREDI